MTLPTLVLTVALFGVLGMWCGQRWVPQNLSALPTRLTMPGWSGIRGCGTNPNWPSGATTSDTPGAKSIGKPFSSISVRTSCSTPSSVQWLWSEHKRDRAAELFSNFVTLWRHHWRSQEASTHTLQEELESLQAYLTLEVQRLGRPVAMDVH